MNPSDELFIAKFQPAAVLRVSGEDALAFLQGQFTQELRHPPGALCAYGLWLNQKGKVLADSFALRNGGEWWLVSMDASATVIRERLEAYIIADDVVLEDMTAEYDGWVVAGERATDWLRGQGVGLPLAGEWNSASADVLLFRGRRDAGESWEWLQRRGSDAPSWLNPTGSDDATWQLLERRRILSATPRIPTDLGPNDLPNEGGLEAVAISYTKGCYLGQEVMARLKSMGQVRRKLAVVHSPSHLATGMALFASGDRKVGEVRSTVAAPEGGTYGIAMISLINTDASQPLAVEPGANFDVKILRRV